MARTTASAPTRSPRQPLVRTVTGPTTGSSAAPEVVLDVRPAYDFLVSLVGEPDAEVLPEDAAWLESSRNSLSDGLKRDIALAFGHEDACKGFGLMIMDKVAQDPSVRTSADTVAMASRLEAVDLLSSHFEREDPSLRTAIELSRRVLTGERELLDEALAAWPSETRPAAEPLLRDPDGYLRAVRRVVRAWHERFAPIEARIARLEQRDADTRRSDVERLPFAEVVEQVTGGIRWVPEPGVRRVLLAPTYFTRPYNWVYSGSDWHLFCYPVADSALDQDRTTAPASLVRLYRALGDDSRLRILRLLADGDLYLTEIAERMGLSKPTVSHHLALLRASGLVSTTESGSLMYYSLRRDHLAGLGPDLAQFLGPDLAAGGTRRN